jgi:hypothetical protein
MKITGVNVDLKDGTAAFSAKITDGDTLADMIRVANAIETSKADGLAGAGTLLPGGATIDDAMQLLGAQPGESLMSACWRVVAEISDLRIEKNLVSDLQKWNVEWRGRAERAEIALDDLKSQRESALAAARAEIDHVRDRLHQETTGAKALAVVCDVKQEEIKKLRAENADLQSKAIGGTDVHRLTAALAEKDARLVEAGHRLSDLNAEVEKLRAANRVIINDSPPDMRVVQRIVQAAIDNEEHRAVVEGRDAEAVDAAERKVVESWRGRGLGEVTR